MFDIQEELKRLPEKPGVYIMKDKNEDAIYVGKASSLKSRVRQYFQPSAAHPANIAAMAEKIVEFEYIVTDTELEALILECNLIKELKPRFNIRLKDDKSYPFIKVTIYEDFPRVFMTRNVVNDGSKYFGPYSSVFSVRETLRLIKKVFPFRSCKRVLPRDAGKDRPCLNYHIKQCLAPCTGNVDKEEYRVVIEDICSFLNGRQESIVSRLEEEMKEASENLDFEKAASIRDRLAALRHIAQDQKVLSLAGIDRDVVGFAAGETNTCVQVFFIRNGKLLGREHFIIKEVGENELRDLAPAFLKEFYSKSGGLVPPEVIVGTEFDDRDIIGEWLSVKRGSKVQIRVPKRGEKLHLAEMVTQNARLELDNYNETVRGRGPQQEALMGLTEILGLPQMPARIEAYDISNTGASEITASRVVYENGGQEKKEYRHYRIRTVDTPDDYASVQEVLARRFRPYKDLKLPDLIMVDGGLGHVSAASKILDILGLSIAVCGMVKDDRHRSRGLVYKGEEIDLKERPEVFRFVTSIQDEAHRFALEYNKKLREKRYSKSLLDEVEGIGPKRKKTLLKHFGSIKKMRQAGMDDFQAVEGISATVAKRLYEFFNRGEEKLM